MYFLCICGISRSHPGIYVLPSGCHFLLLYVPAAHRHRIEIIKQYEYGFVHIRLYTIINQELINLILSFGKEVRVLSPDTLVNRIKAVADTLSSLY